SEMPVDLSVLAEVSPLLKEPRQFWSDLDATQRQLRPDDRIGVASFMTLTHQDLPLAPPPIDLSHEPIERGTEPRLYDALARAFMTPASRVASHLLVVYSDGTNAQSVLASSTVLGISQKSDARLIIVIGELAAKARPFGRPKLDPLLEKLRDITDGRVIKPGQLASTVASMLADLRQSYLLGFVPTGVDPKGWHTITVRFVGSGSDKYTVRARRGYFGG